MNTLVLKLSLRLNQLMSSNIDQNTIFDRWLDLKKDTVMVVPTEKSGLLLWQIADWIAKIT